MPPAAPPRSGAGCGSSAMAAPYAFAVIPARGGSKGLPGKNLKALGALSLIGHAVASCREATRLARFLVSTDSEAIAAEARRHGAEVPFLRPATLASDEAGMVPVLQHAVRWLEANGGPRPDLVVTLQPTSPFRVGADIDETIAKVVETDADSAQTVTEAAYHPFFMKTLDGDRTVALFHDGHKYVRRQDAPSPTSRRRRAGPLRASSSARDPTRGRTSSGATTIFRPAWCGTRSTAPSSASATPPSAGVSSSSSGCGRWGWHCRRSSIRAPRGRRRRARRSRWRDRQGRAGARRGAVVSGVLIVAEAPRSAGEYRRPWVRRLYPSYVRRYQRLIARACARVGGESATLLAGREFVEEDELPVSVARRYYDAETLRAEDSLAQRARELFDAWWPAKNVEPDLTADGVWLPDVMSVGKPLLLRLEVVEFAAILQRVLDEVKPDHVVLVTGASSVEQVARALATDRGLPTRVASWFPPAVTLAAAGRWLRRREERQALDSLLRHERRPVAPSGSRYLLSVSHARHFMMVNPLAHALHERGLDCRVVASTRENTQLEAPLRQLAKEEGTSAAYFMDYLPPREAVRLVRALSPVMRRLRRAPAAPRSALDSVLARYRRHAATWTLATARLCLAAAFRILDAHRPDAVVITSDRRT